MPREEGRLVHIDTLPKMMNFCMLMILGRSMICGYKCSIHPSRECIVSWFIMPLNGWIQPLSCTYPAVWVLVGWLLFLLVVPILLCPPVCFVCWCISRRSVNMIVSYALFVVASCSQVCLCAVFEPNFSQKS